MYDVQSTGICAYVFTTTHVCTSQDLAPLQRHLSDWNLHGPHSSSWRTKYGCLSNIVQVWLNLSMANYLHLYSSYNCQMIEQMSHIKPRQHMGTRDPPLLQLKAWSTTCWPMWGQLWCTACWKAWFGSMASPWGPCCNLGCQRLCLQQPHQQVQRLHPVWTRGTRWEVKKTSTHTMIAQNVPKPRDLWSMFIKGHFGDWSSWKRYIYRILHICSEHGRVNLSWHRRRINFVTLLGFSTPHTFAPSSYLRWLQDNPSAHDLFLRNLICNLWARRLHSDNLPIRTTQNEIVLVPTGTLFGLHHSFFEGSVIHIVWMFKSCNYNHTYAKSQHVRCMLSTHHFWVKSHSHLTHALLIQLAWTTIS